jgi:hypothetical protein
VTKSVGLAVDASICFFLFLFVAVPFKCNQALIGFW